MNTEQVLKEFEDAQAILKGHFLLSSGLHSDTYLQCARVLMDSKRAERLCSSLAKKIKEQIGNKKIDLVVSPAMGGVVVGYEMGRQLNVPAIFCERTDGKFQIRRGFSIENNANVLVVEDVVTTGKSSLEAFECIRSAGGNIIAEASLVNRAGENNPLDVPLISLMNLDVISYKEDSLPDSLKNIPAVKPGSRWLKQKA